MSTVKPTSQEISRELDSIHHRLVTCEIDSLTASVHMALQCRNVKNLDPDDTDLLLAKIETIRRIAMQKNLLEMLAKPKSR